MPREVWFQLVDGEGNVVGSADRVKELPDKAIVGDLRDAVKLTFAGSPLAGIDAPYLTVFAHRAANQALLYSSPVTDLGKDEDNPLIVQVPMLSKSFVTDTDITVINHLPDGAQEELEYYKAQGERIRMNCAEYCEKVLNQIDKLYAENAIDSPFICVEGSSGMGKSQLAFALGGRRPWFYWLSTQMTGGSQLMYSNFEGITRAFREVATMDNIKRHELDYVLGSRSHVYFNDPLWTYGFIRTLLDRCTLTESEREHAQMMTFDDIESLHVKKCSARDVWDTIARMKEEKKLIPFFILDEMTVNSDPETHKLAAFQRNVFRVCRLVVVLMGTDAKINELIYRSNHSYCLRIPWMTIVPRFPRYQLMLRTPDEIKTWSEVEKRWPVVQRIVEHSRGRFGRNFIAKVIEYAKEKVAELDALALPGLLDTAFDHVAREEIDNKRFMDSKEGKEAQLMAISYTTAARMPPIPAARASPGGIKGSARRKASGAITTSLRKRRKVEPISMHWHYANLVDKHFTELNMRRAVLLKGGESFWRQKCQFPAMEEDVLLYLAVLGGKKSGYFTGQGNSFSVKRIFLDYVSEKDDSTDENKTAAPKDYKTFENMVAHAVFCSSRRNGVQGIPFPAFFDCLIGEFRDRRWKKMEIGIQGVLQGLADNVASLQDTLVPFLGPPNAKWPKCILDANSFGCNFGHLVRAGNRDRSDVYVQAAVNEPGTALFLCECKHWKDCLDRPAFDGIIDGLDSAWGVKNWSVVLLFCSALAVSRSEWGHADIACVKIKHSEGVVEWVSPQFPPPTGCTGTAPPKKIMIVVETGPMGRFEQV